jgi:hypothetical protein
MHRQKLLEMKAQVVIDGWEGAPPVEHGFSKAAWIPAHDRITLPRPETFSSAEDYYQTRFHEAGHATGHPPASIGTCPGTSAPLPMAGRSWSPR